ncbi:hypothetical protein AD998_20365 [bacterium 336/3]|nr:hypothetical protein AD998_20365 [bacterium 336/3]
MSEQKQCPYCHTFFEGRKNKIYCSEKCKLDFFFEQRNQGIPLKKDLKETPVITALKLEQQIQQEKQAHEEKMKLLEIELRKLAVEQTPRMLPKRLQTNFEKILQSILKESNQKLPKKFFQEKIADMERWIEDLIESEKQELNKKYPEYEMIAYFLQNFENILKTLSKITQRTFSYKLEEETLQKSKKLLHKS